MTRASEMCPGCGEESGGGLCRACEAEARAIEARASSVAGWCWFGVMAFVAVALVAYECALAWGLATR